MVCVETVTERARGSKHPPLSRRRVSVRHPPDRRLRHAHVDVGERRRPPSCCDHRERGRALRGEVGRRAQAAPAPPLASTSVDAVARSRRPRRRAPRAPAAARRTTPAAPAGCNRAAGRGDASPRRGLRRARPAVRAMSAIDGAVGVRARATCASSRRTYATGTRSVTVMRNVPGSARRHRRARDPRQPLDARARPRRCRRAAAVRRVARRPRVATAAAIDVLHAGHAHVVDVEERRLARRGTRVPTATNATIAPSSVIRSRCGPASRLTSMRRSRMRGSIVGGHRATSEWNPIEVELGLEAHAGLRLDDVLHLAHERVDVGRASRPGRRRRSSRASRTPAAPPMRQALAPADLDEPPGRVARRVGEHRARVLAAGLVLPAPADDLVDARRRTAPGRRRARRTSRATTTSAVPNAELPVAEPEVARRPTLAADRRRRASRPGRGRARRRSRAPCPPAFIRTAPPTDPGMPDEELEAAEPRRRGRGAPAPAARPRRPPRRGRRSRSTSSCSNAPPSDERDPVEAGVGDEQVRAAADHEHRHVGAAEHVGDRREIVLVRRRARAPRAARRSGRS